MGHDSLHRYPKGPEGIASPIMAKHHMIASMGITKKSNAMAEVRDILEDMDFQSE